MDFSKTVILVFVMFCVIHQPETGASTVNSPVGTGKQEDVYILLDCSRSMWKYDRIELLAWLAELADGLDIGNGTRLGLGLYSDTHHVAIPINNTFSKQDLVEKIRNTVCHESEATYISRAIQGMMTDGLPDGLERYDVPRVCILTTDGESRSKMTSQDNAYEAKKKKIYMMTLGIGRDVDIEEIKSIASEPKSDFAYLVPGYSSLDVQLKDKMSSVLRKAESREANKSACGWDDNNPFDTVLVYDEGELGRSTSSKVIKLFKDFADMIDMNSGNMRLSVYPKRCQGVNTGNITLNTHVKSTTFKDGLDQLEARHDGLSALLKDVRMNAFKKERGGRWRATQRLVLVLDEPLELGSDLHKQTLWAKSDYIEIFVIYIGTGVDEKLVWQHSYTEDSPSHSLILDSPAGLDTRQARDFFREKFCAGLY